ncbi:ATP-dependent DNA helicase Q1 isoform X1 [Pseudonaja textilis]|uniref:ATP-dependent DNA helicase Q1 isoform X1 n=2 Tax=Pseudonaja textilis TaxID=8673 RepID=UPI000EA87844|nr:ATP-dependent DNA helicase Q1 isoform X1 [Pseudonaja textilis]XP_026567254.1 ATP-dependent DNA helicase Q1 isoform X1 [Pseudonaja textilis]
MSTTLSVLQEELGSIDDELQALEIQIQELLEHQQQLIQKKTILKKKIKQFSDTKSGSSKETESATEDWNKEDFPWSAKIRDVLQKSFGLQKFRPLQLEAINATMAGRDVFLVMPTGGGKSLCYQLPAEGSQGFTLVICPLISLMEDQLMMLEQLGVSATLLNASSSKEHVKWVHAEMLSRNSQLKLLYVTPEKIAKSKMFMSKLEKAYQTGQLTRIAVDEVHCCSQWGHDFRPDYKLLGILKRQFPNAPLIGLTATATGHVLHDAQNILCVSKCITFTASFNRPNLYYEVRQKPSSAQNCIEDIVKLINGRYKGLSGIIYCFSQKDAEQVTMSLQKLGIKAGTYHANMEPKDKSRVHKRWCANEIQVVVATVAFGMGIDKPDVRFVIHHSMSKSMENYYQESGRAGRDDQRADCILYYGFGDIFRISTMVVMENVGQQKLYGMVSYCHDVGRCRRVQIAHHFDEAWDSASCNKMCDNCCQEEALEKMDVTEHCRELIKILKQVDQMKQKFTPLKLIDAWLGKGLSKLGLEIAAPKLLREVLERIVAHLILQQYLKEDFSFTAFATISYVKIGPRANLLKDKAHVITMQGIQGKNKAAKGKCSQLSSPRTPGKKMKFTSPNQEGDSPSKDHVKAKKVKRTASKEEDELVIID